MELKGGLTEVIHEKHLSQCLAHTESGQEMELNSYQEKLLGQGWAFSEHSWQISSPN